MRGTVILLPTVEEQREAGDRELVDPHGVKVGTGLIPVFSGFNYSVPDDVLGSVSNVRVENGRLVGDIDIVALDASQIDWLKVDAGITGIPMSHKADGTVSAMDLMAVGLKAKR